MIDWFFATLRQYPEIAIFLTLAIGYYFGKFTFKGIGLGSVTATLLAGVVIGQIGITIAQPLKATVFLMFLFAVGYAVGPQFVRGVAKDGVPQALFSVVQCVFCLAGPCRDREVRRLRPRLRGRAVLGVADDLRRDGPVDRRHQPAGSGRRPGQGPARLDAGRLRRDLHVRHDGLGDRDRRPRPQAARHQSRRRLQGLRGRSTAATQGTGRAGLGLAPLGSAGVPRRSQGGRAVGLRVVEAEALVPQTPRGGGLQSSTSVTPSPVRPAHPPQRDDRGGDRGHRSARGRRRGGRGRARRARDGARGERRRGRGSGAAGRAGRGRRRAT